MFGILSLMFECMMQHIIQNIISDQQPTLQQYNIWVTCKHTQWQYLFLFFCSKFMKKLKENRIRFSLHFFFYFCIFSFLNIALLKDIQWFAVTFNVLTTFYWIPNNEIMFRIQKLFIVTITHLNVDLELKTKNETKNKKKICRDSDNSISVNSSKQKKKLFIR